MDLVSTLQTHPAVRRLVGLIGASTRASKFLTARGSHGSSTSFLAAATASELKRLVVLVVAHLDEADETVAELSAHGVRAELFPALETLPGESAVSMDLFAARLGVLRQFADVGEGESAEQPSVLVCPIQALMQPTPAQATLDSIVRTVRKGQRLDPAQLLRWLEAAGYSRVDAIEDPGDFSMRGGILDIFPPPATGSSRGRGGTDASTLSTGAPVRLDFFGDEVDRINEIDLDTMASDRTVEGVEIYCASLDAVLRPEGENEAGNRGTKTVARARANTSSAPALDHRTHASILDHLPPSGVVFLHETFEVLEQARGYFERLTDGGTGIFAPPAVLKLLQERFFCFVEVNQFSPGTVSSTDHRVELPVGPLAPLPKDAPDALRELAALATGTPTAPDAPAPPTPSSSPAPTSSPMQVAVFASNDGELSRLKELIAEHTPGSPLRTENAYVHRGFRWGEEHTDTAAAGSSAFQPIPLLVVPYHELLHRFEARRSALRARRGGVSAGGGGGGADKLRAGRALDTFLDFATGDYVVHRDHGIGIFRGLTVMKAREVKRAAPITLPGEKAKKRRGPKGEGDSPDGTQLGEEEFLTIEFAARANLHVPTSKIDQVQKYIGGFRGSPTLSTLGGTRWKKQKQDVADSVKDLAGELLRIRAAREHLPGTRFPADTTWQREFEAEFPFEETPDQLAALAEIKRDMQSERPMDRLLCGDVGFGKTELAVRAAFKAVEFGKQVAVLVPTTVLAEQHERTFKSRFADYPFRVESISRFKTTQEINEVLSDLRKGAVDVIIGTHRILSKDVKFSDLGLVVIDEEQRFGVEHKERLLSLRMTVDVLTLSATPIPRTLHLSMLGLRDISSLTTAPIDRRAVVTEVIPYNQRRVQQAIARELSRGGQCYFVHNRVYDIISIADDIQRLSPPGTRIVIGHGQMPDGELEEVMLKFMKGPGPGGADILVSTTIIESGIDIPTANTMFIDNADRFGLADLHQLRGRVGRYKHRAYCYLLLDPERTIPEKSVKRLKAIEEFSMLGAGFKIAMRDLEIRGAGNILGPEQSGHIATVGYEMYCQLLERAVKELRHERTDVASETSIEIGVTGLIPRSYIPSDQRRMEAYRRIALAQSAEDLRRVETELKQAYGEYPASGGVDRLLQLADLRVAVSAMGVRSVGIRDKDIIMRVKPESAQALATQLAKPPVSASTPPSSRPPITLGAAASSASASSPKVQVTILPPSKTDADKSHFEVYYRPPEHYLSQPISLLNVLRKRLATP